MKCTASGCRPTNTGCDDEPYNFNVTPMQYFTVWLLPECVYAYGCCLLFPFIRLSFAKLREWKKKYKTNWLKKKKIQDFLAQHRSRMREKKVNRCYFRTNCDRYTQSKVNEHKRIGRCLVVSFLPSEDQFCCHCCSSSLSHSNICCILPLISSDLWSCRLLFLFSFALHIDHNAQDESETNTNFKSKSLDFGCFLIQIIFIFSLSRTFCYLFDTSDWIQFTDRKIEESKKNTHTPIEDNAIIE